MKLERIIRELELTEAVPGVGTERAVTGAYCSDLLSDVMAHAQPGDLWITVQVHQNIVAVAVMAELAGIVLVGGMRPDAEALAKAAREKVVLLTTPLAAFEVAGRLHHLLRQERGQD